MEMDPQVKLAVAMSILRSRSSQSQSAKDVQHWKKKAKERKKELLKLKQELKEVQDDMLSEMFPQTTPCKCYFFESLSNLASEGQSGGEKRDTYDINQVLFRQFLRHLRLRERLKNQKDTSMGHELLREQYADDEKGKLAIAINFLVDFGNILNPAYNKQCFATYSHQAVDFIKDTLQGLLTKKEDEKFIVGPINNLITHLIRSICYNLKHDDLDSAMHDNQFHVQHIMRKLGAQPYIGQRILLAASQRIASVTDSLLCMDPFDATITEVHNCMFIMIQLVEFLVADYTYLWTTDPTFSDILSKLLHPSIRYLWAPSLALDEDGNEGEQREENQEAATLGFNMQFNGQPMVLHHLNDVMNCRFLKTYTCINYK